MTQQSLAAISARYQTIVTEIAFPAAVAAQILQPNSRRWYVRFDLGVGAGGQTVFAMPNSLDLTVVANSNVPFDLKFRDCPSIVTGAFGGFGQAGTSIVVTECVYLD